MCHCCGARIGEIHRSGCDKEMCPSCGRQLVSCGHLDDVGRRKLPRIPYIQPVTVCAVCGRPFPRFFKVNEEDWMKYVIPPLQNKVLCRRCYEQMQVLFPDGWKRTNPEP